jgi:hypothetical protein
MHAFGKRTALLSRVRDAYLVFRKIIYDSFKNNKISRTLGGQSNGAQIRWWHLWWQCKAYAVSLSHTKNAANTARERHHN